VAKKLTHGVDFPIPQGCVRHIMPAIVLFLWHVVLFGVPVSTLNRKIEGGWGLLDVEAKCRAMMFIRLRLNG
jgi:hypothetical protein